jgi:hypothetical protein
MNTTHTPPPDRDLPDHAGLRHQVVQATVPGGRRSPRLVPVAAAAAGVTLVAGVAALAGSDRLDQSGSGAGSQPGPVGAQAERWLQECLGSRWQPDPRSSPSGAPMPPDPAGARVLVQRADAAGMMLVVGRFGPTGGIATCDVDPSGHVPHAGMVSSDLLPWPAFNPAQQAIDVDLSANQEGVVGTVTNAPDNPALHVVAGRVADAVTRVTVTWSDGQSQDATIQDGMYGARRVVPRAGGDIPPLTVTVRAYDVHGGLLGTASGNGGLPPSGTSTPPSPGG